MINFLHSFTRRVKYLITALLVGVVPIALAAQPAASDSGEDSVRVKVEAIVPRELISGQNYILEPEAVVRRAVALYVLDTSYGKTEVAGTVKLLERIHELRAIEALKEMEKLDVYKEALKKSGAGPLDTVKELADDPVGTVSETARGLGGFLADIGYSIVSSDPSQENVAKTVVGFSAAKRQIAHELGVNPYSRFEPLQDHLSEVAWTSVGGSLTITKAFSTITGTAGRVVGITSGSSTARKLVRDKSLRELNNRNLKALKGMGVGEDLAETLLEGYSYDPEAMTRLVVALDSMDGVAGRSDVVARAATATTPYQATNMRDWLELIAAYHAIIAPVQRLLIVSTAPFVVDDQGIVHGVFPTDYVTSEPGFTELINAVSQEIRVMGFKTGPFYATGTIDPGMADVLRSAGWAEVHDHAERILFTE